MASTLGRRSAATRLRTANTSPAIIFRENSAPLRVQGCDAFAQRSSLLGAYIPVSVHVPPEVQEDGGAAPEFSGRAP